jgi:mono/diheme cytochrome c family protein
LGETREIIEGRRLLEQLSCRRCHASAGKGNRLATPLDTLADAKTPEEIVAAIKAPAQGMPDFRLTDRQMVLLVNAILGGARQNRAQSQTRPLRVHFEHAQSGKENVFSRKCGACHRLLSERQGAIGKGDVGPNLSGLLTEYYPRTFGQGQAWTEERLKRWLLNPRAVRVWSGMPPVELSTAEFRELLEMLMVAPDGKK